MLEEALYWGSVERLKPCFVGAVEMRPPSFLLWPPAAVMESPLKLVKMSSVFSRLLLVIMLHHDRKVTNTVLCFTLSPRDSVLSIKDSHSNVGNSGLEG